MKKNLFLFISIIVLLISCKSEEQKQYNELIESSKTLYEKIVDRPDYLYSSNNYSDSRYLSILDEKMRIVTKGNELVEKSKIDDRPTSGQIQELFNYLSKIDEIMKNNTSQKTSDSNNTNTQSSGIDLSKLNIKYEILEQESKQEEKFGEKEWVTFGTVRKFYLDSLRNTIYEDGQYGKILYEYSNSLLIRKTSYSDSDIFILNKFYNESEKLIKEEETKNGELVNVFKYSYSNGNKIKKVQYDGNGNEKFSSIEKIDSQKFDKFGNIIRDGSITYEYKYDSNNNWVEKSQKENGKIIYKTKREIKVR
jgi:hypothetical protein